MRIIIDKEKLKKATYKLDSDAEEEVSTRGSEPMEDTFNASYDKACSDIQELIDKLGKEEKQMTIYIIKKEVLNEDIDEVYEVDVDYFTTASKASDMLIKIYKATGDFLWETTERIVKTETIGCSHCGSMVYNRRTKYFIEEVEVKE